MHKLSPREREELGINRLPMAARFYIADLETELDRVCTRQARLRKNVRSMQKKLELANLKALLYKVSK